MPKNKKRKAPDGGGDLAQAANDKSNKRAKTGGGDIDGTCARPPLLRLVDAAAVGLVASCMSVRDLGDLACINKLLGEAVKARYSCRLMTTS